jgi:prepilin-type N-terminal cleavage/methylation domain-containing protein
MSRSRRGFTLLETIVAVALSAIILLAITTMVRYFYTQDANTVGQWRSVAAGRASIESAMVTLRSASVLTAASASSLSFTTSAGGSTQSFTYALSGTSLLETGSATSTIATAVMNPLTTPIFTYYNANGALLTAPIATSAVRSVLVDALVNAGGTATGTTLLSGAALRNVSATSTP